MAVLFNFGVGEGGGNSTPTTTLQNQAKTLTSDDFSYTGTYQLSTDSEGWTIKFLTSGTLTFNRTAPPVEVEIFCVGGGGSASYAGYLRGGGGGGGGYTTTCLANYVNVPWTITIGSGGTAPTSSNQGGNRGGTSRCTYTKTDGTIGVTAFADGGKGASVETGGTGTHLGGDGGSGGATCEPGYDYASAGNSGGSDGSDQKWWLTSHTGSTSGKGQHSTTRAFGQVNGTIYAGGGGAGGSNSGTTYSPGAGGVGGGGSNGKAGTVNTGGGGGGSTSGKGGAGGSGIIIMRNFRGGGR